MLLWIIIAIQSATVTVDRWEGWRGGDCPVAMQCQYRSYPQAGMWPVVTQPPWCTLKRVINCRIDRVSRVDSVP